MLTSWNTSKHLGKNVLVTVTLRKKSNNTGVMEKTKICAEKNVKEYCKLTSKTKLMDKSVIRTRNKNYLKKENPHCNIIDSRSTKITVMADNNPHFMMNSEEQQEQKYRQRKITKLNVVTRVLMHT